MRKMKAIIVLLLSLAAFKVGHAVDIGTCKHDEYRVDVAYCQITFVEKMTASSDAFGECSTFYAEAYACFSATISKCFNDTMEENNETIALLKSEFGDEDFFCVHGFLHPMEEAMKGIAPENCTDSNYNNHTKCEAPFQKAFTEGFESSDTDLDNIATKFAEADTCHKEVALSCKISLDYRQFFDYHLNPFNREVMKKIAEAENKILQGENFREDSNATYLAVGIVAILLLLILCIVFFFLWRRDKRRADIRRRKSIERRKKAGKATGETEMQPLQSGSAVQTTSDQVSSA